MFTGIVQAMGRIAATESKGDGLRIAVDIGVRDVADVAVGDSIAINGCCLTIVEVNGSTLSFDVSAATLACTTGLDRVGDVNVEMALRLSDRLGGHLMTGHVDGVGTVTRFDAVADDGEGSWRLEIAAPGELARFIAAKGSIAVQGVSLTVNGVTGARLSREPDSAHARRDHAVGAHGGRARQSRSRPRGALHGPSGPIS